MISAQQLDKMEESYSQDGLLIYFLIEMRRHEKCYAVPYWVIKQFTNTMGDRRKSLTEDFLDKNGIIVPRTMTSTCWLKEEQECLLEMKDKTGNDAVEHYNNTFDDRMRSASSIKSKFYQVRKEGVSAPNQYLHYSYDIDSMLDIISKYHEENFNCKIM